LITLFLKFSFQAFSAFVVDLPWRNILDPFIMSATSHSKFWQASSFLEHHESEKISSTSTTY
jgi:hypothetical protein